MRKLGNRAEQRERADAVLKLVQLSHLAQRRPRELSGGQQQRVAVARAVVSSPQVLLLDEPLSNLDARLRESMQEELIQLHRETGLTTVFVTHDQEEALSLSDRIVLLNAGRIEQEGAPADLYAAPRTRFAASFMGSTNLLDIELEATGAGATARLPAGQALRVGETPPADGVAIIMFRQEDVRLAPAPAADAAAAGAATGDAVTANAPIATVATRIFLGARTRYVLDLGGHRVRCLAPADQFFDVGEAVAVLIQPDRIRILSN